MAENKEKKVASKAKEKPKKATLYAVRNNSSREMNLLNDGKSTEFKSYSETEVGELDSKGVEAWKEKLKRFPQMLLVEASKEGE